MKCTRSLRSFGRTIKHRHVSPRASRFASIGSYQQPAPLLLCTFNSHLTENSQISLRSSRGYASSQASSSTEPSKTPLYDLHLTHKATMVPFGGYSMPVSYPSLSISASHKFTRTNASVFDVSHMVQHHFTGPGAASFLETVTPSSLSSLAEYTSTLSVFLNRKGGIVDDTMLTRLGPEKFYVVTNAACREKDLAFLEEELRSFSEKGGESVDWTVLEERGLVALQGPLSEKILEDVLEDPNAANLKELYFGQSKHLRIKLSGGKISHDCLVSRGGYTGEDGYEISITPEETVAVTEAILDAGPEKVQLAGLGARDSLRLEAGMCLYGHDLDETITPPEAALTWVIGRDRRTGGGFNGADVILPQTKKGAKVARKRIGLVVEGAPAREGAEIVSSEGENIGIVTSGCPSPTLGKNIAMGYVKEGFRSSGTEIGVMVRGRQRKATVTKMPFVPSQYYKAAA